MGGGMLVEMMVLVSSIVEFLSITTVLVKLLMIQRKLLVESNCD